MEPVIVYLWIMFVVIVLWIVSGYDTKPFDKNDSNTGLF